MAAIGACPSSTRRTSNASFEIILAPSGASWTLPMMKPRSGGFPAWVGRSHTACKESDPRHANLGRRDEVFTGAPNPSGFNPLSYATRIEAIGSVVGTRVDANGHGVIDFNDCSFGLIGSTVDAGWGSPPTGRISSRPASAVSRGSSPGAQRPGRLEQRRSHHGRRHVHRLLLRPRPRERA